jgi:hypothetical protein
VQLTVGKINRIDESDYWVDGTPQRLRDVALAADIAHLRVGCWSLRVVTGNML